MRNLKSIKRYKNIYYTILFLSSFLVNGSIVSSVLATSEINYEVNIASGINITIPSDTVTLSLNPFATAFGSTDLPVTVKTNNPTGYTLTMSPSDDTTTSLTRTGGTETIPTLDDLSGGYTEQTFTTNKWGYKLSSSNYLPFATSNEITTTNTPTAASGNTSTVTFAAKGDTTLTAGTYSLEITFAAVTNYVPPAPISTCTTPVPGITYMQEITDQNKATVMASMTPNQQYYLRDRRDETPYCVSNITTKNANNEDQNAIWMTQNLRITGIISATDSNFTGSDFNVSAYDLKTDGASGGACSSASGGYNNACSHVPDADDLTATGLTVEEIGAWYNYAAATAGTITGSNSTDATEDICPAGWSLPSYDTTKPANSVHSLSGSNYTSIFSPVNGGNYYNGSPSGTGNGYWWSATADDGSYRNSLRYIGSIGSSLSTCSVNRILGMYVRCVRL